MYYFWRNTPTYQPTHSNTAVSTVSKFFEVLLALLYFLFLQRAPSRQSVLGHAILCGDILFVGPSLAYLTRHIFPSNFCLQVFSFVSQTSCQKNKKEETFECFQCAKRRCSKRDVPK